MNTKNRKVQKKDAKSGADGANLIRQPAVAIGQPPASRRLWLPLSLVVLLLSGGLLFYNLGHYPLWDDEAHTAIFARGIARTGDTLGLIDGNLYAFRNGRLLKNLHGRSEPPAPYYLAAPFVGGNNTNSLWPRVPFAVCGLLTVMFLIYWMA